MSDDEFNAIFGGRVGKPITFAERVGRAGPETDESDTAPDDATEGAYRAYGFLPTGNVGETCDIRRWINGTNVQEGVEFPYRLLMQIGWVAEEQLRLILPDSIVLIEGRNLRELRQKLARRQVTFIQQFNPRIWPSSPQEMALIERIEVLRPSSHSTAP